MILFLTMEIEPTFIGIDFIDEVNIRETAKTAFFIHENNTKSKSDEFFKYNITSFELINTTKNNIPTIIIKKISFDNQIDTYYIKPNNNIIITLTFKN